MSSNAVGSGYNPPAMTYRMLAGLVAVVHLFFVVFVTVGALLVLRWRWLMWIHLPAAVWGILIEFAGWTCPLTPLENWLRGRGGAAGYQETFLEHYVFATLYPAGLSRTTEITLGLIVLAINVAVYARVFSRSA